MLVLLSLRVSRVCLLHYHSFNERNDMNTSVNDADEIFEKSRVENRNTFLNCVGINAFDMRETDA